MAHGAESHARLPEFRRGRDAHQPRGGCIFYPTYVLVDEQGEILARTNGLPDEFLAMIEEAVERGSEA